MYATGQVPASREVRIPCGDTWLYGDLTVPTGALGLVLFVHGSGRHSARNRQVAEQLQHACIATLLFDLLTTLEQPIDVHSLEHRFDIALITGRLQDATLWAMAQPSLQRLPIGYFAASTASAAAIIAAARLGRQIAAVVSFNGRPDLAGPVALAAATAPTLLIVCSADPSVIQLNEESLAHLSSDKGLKTVEGITPLSEEKSTLAAAAELAVSWFKTHLSHSQLADTPTVKT